MIEYEELRLRLLESEKTVKNLKEALAIDTLKEEISELEKESSKPDFWDDMENSQKVMQKIGSLKAKVASYEGVKNDYDDALVMIELANEEEDADLLDDCTSSVEEIEKKLESLTLSTLLSGEFDGKNALLTFHAGAGGTEAQDWAEMLFRMYNRWGERHGYKVSTLDYLDGDVAGIKSATILVEGENAYGYLKGEMGIHRLVRVSPFDSSGRRHTSFASVEVMPEIEMMWMLKSVMKILKWMFTGHPAQAVRKSIKPLPLFALHIYLPALWYPAKLNAVSTKTVRLQCVCLNQSLLKSRKEKTLKELKILKATKKKSLGAVKFVHMSLCHTQWLKTIELILKWVILPQLWMVTLTVSLTLI